jgi:hypothetical protein
VLKKKKYKTISGIIVDRDGQMYFKIGESLYKLTVSIEMTKGE